jgi:hypothetical protein
MDEDQFQDAIDDTVTAEVIDNGDGEHVIVNLFTDGGVTCVGIALTADDANRMAEVLLTLAAGLG